MLSGAIAEQLRARDLDVVAVVGEPRLVGTPDKELLAHAVADERVLVSADVADFAAIATDWCAVGREHAGLVYVTSRAPWWFVLWCALFAASATGAGRRRVATNHLDLAVPPRLVPPGLPRVEDVFDTEVMGERRANRGVTRSDPQILEHDDDVQLLLAVARGQLIVDSTNRMQLRRLAREELLLVGFGLGTSTSLLPRGQRIVACARGELPAPLAD